MRDEKLRRYFKALADRTRFDIVQELGRTGERSVSDLCLNLGTTQPLMSWHVRMLRNAGVIATRRQGRQVFCSLDRASLAAFQQRFEALIEGQAPLVEPSSARHAPIPG
ncbi:MAG TPA: metalloregulator ArsR/SmtB family transcription factor [Chloroflexota bacterium]|nr:metalloregulator ArsR/SmtB family transcription factor [Chloroflexota bacterium]